MTQPAPRIPFPRLRNRPTLHWFNIGEQARSRHINFHDTTAYTIAQHVHDDQVTNKYLLKMHYSCDENQPTPVLTLHQPRAAEQMLTTYFHPLDWPEYRDASVTELIERILPETDVVRPSLQIYEADRWMSESSQRAAETLCYRITAQGLQLPMHMPLVQFARPTPAPKPSLWQRIAKTE